MVTISRLEKRRASRVDEEPLHGQAPVTKSNRARSRKQESVEEADDVQAHV